MHESVCKILEAQVKAQRAASLLAHTFLINNTDCVPSVPTSSTGSEDMKMLVADLNSFTDTLLNNCEVVQNGGAQDTEVEIV